MTKDSDTGYNHSPSKHGGLTTSYSPKVAKTKMFLPHSLVKLSILGSLRDREVACSASDLQGWNFESCVWRAVSSNSSHHPQVVLLAQFRLYVHESGLKPDSFHFIYIYGYLNIYYHHDYASYSCSKKHHNVLRNTMEGEILLTRLCEHCFWYRESIISGIL